MPSFVKLKFVGKRGARTDQTHVAAQHVDDLRELVDAVAAHDVADAGDALVVGEFENFLALFLSAIRRRTLAEADPLLDVFAMSIVPNRATHRAKLQEVELLAANSDSSLAEENRSTILEPNR